MSGGPYSQFYPTNTASTITITNETSASETDLITFMKGSAGSNKVLYSDTALTYNPNAEKLTSTNIDATAVTAVTTVASGSIGTNLLRLSATGAHGTNDQQFSWDSIEGVILEGTTSPYEGRLTLSRLLTEGSSNRIVLNDRTTVNNFNMFSDSDEFNMSFNSLKFPLNLNENGLMKLTGTGAAVQYTSQTAASLDYWRLVATGATAASNFRFNYFDGTNTNKMFSVSPIGTIELGTASTSATGISILGVGTSAIACGDTAKGKISFFMNNDTIVYSGSVSPAFATLTSAGIYTVESSSALGEVITSTFRAHKTRSSGTSYVSPNFVAQNTTSASAFGSGSYCYLANNGTTWTASSDRRLKTNIKPFGDCLHKILALKPVTYQWIHSGDSAVGFVAQDVLEVIPELVNTPDDPEKMLGVDLTNLTSFLVKAIQEQQVMIQELTARIKVLEGSK